MTNVFDTDLKRRLEDSQFAVEYGSSIAKAEIAVTLTQARRSNNITQQELAKRLCKNQSYIAKLEGGDSNPTVGNIGKILAKMGLRLVTGTNSLSSKIENKEVSILSIDTNPTFFNYNYLCSPANQQIYPAFVDITEVPKFTNMSYFVSSIAGSFACIGADYEAEGTTDILWQASEMDKNTDIIELKGESL